MLGPLPVGLLGSAEPPVFSGYDANYLIGVTNLEWVPALPQGVGGGPAVWSVTPSLPAGLSINPSTGAIYGTPTATANSVYTVSATNSGGVASQNVTITVTNDTFVEFSSGGVHNWNLPNGVSTAYIRCVLASGGGGGAAADEGGGNHYSGGGGGSGRHFTNLDYRNPPIGNLPSLPPGTTLTITIGVAGDGGYVYGDPGTDGTFSMIEFQDDIVSPIFVAGGGGAPAAYPAFLLYGEVRGGIAGGGNNGSPGFNGYANGDFSDPGMILMGGAGGYGISSPFSYPPSFVFDARGSGAGVYFTSPAFGSYDIQSAGAAVGGGGGGGGQARSDTSIITDATLRSGSAAGDGYCRLDWGQSNTYWANFIP